MSLKTKTNKTVINTIKSTCHHNGRAAMDGIGLGARKEEKSGVGGDNGLCFKCNRDEIEGVRGCLFGVN